MRHETILKSTRKLERNSDSWYGHFLNLTCDIGDPPSRAPCIALFCRLLIKSVDLSIRGIIICKFGTQPLKYGKYIRRYCKKPETTRVGNYWLLCQGKEILEKVLQLAAIWTRRWFLTGNLKGRGLKSTVVSKLLSLK